MQTVGTQKIMNKAKIILAAIFVPPSTLAILVLASEAAEKYGIKQLSEKTHEMLNMLMFWPMFLYEHVIPEPIGGWEGFENENAVKFIIAALVAYSCTKYEGSALEKGILKRFPARNMHPPKKPTGDFPARWQD